MKLFSWNVNGIRAVINKGEFAKFIEQYDPDVICLQETKAKQNQAEIDHNKMVEFQIKENLFKPLEDDTLDKVKEREYIRHLREKIGDDAQKPRFIKNVWGVGYIIE